MRILCAQRRPGERPGNRSWTRTGGWGSWCSLNEGRAKGPATAPKRASIRWCWQGAQRRPGERPGNRSVESNRALIRSLNAQRRPGERPGNRPFHHRRDVDRRVGRSTKAGRKARQPHGGVLPPRPAVAGRSTKAGRKARQPPRTRNTSVLMSTSRSTKAGRKARQPRELPMWPVGFDDDAQRRPGERPGNRPAPATTAGSRAALNEGRAKGPATAAFNAGRPGRGFDRSTKAGRKARQPPGTVSRPSAGSRSLNEGRAKGPATASPSRCRATKTRRPSLNEGRAKGPATACRRSVPRHPRTAALNEGRAKGPATAGTNWGEPGVLRLAQRRPGERPGNRR